MEQATPAVRDLARLLLALEANRNEHAEAEAHAVLSVFEKMRSYLSRLVGVVGFQALLTRALALAKPQARWLEAVRVQPDATLEGFSETVRLQSAEAATEGSTAFLTQLLGLLITFIGEALTLRLVGEVWPQARLEGNQLRAEEIRHE